MKKTAKSRFIEETTDKYKRNFTLFEEIVKFV